MIFRISTSFCAKIHKINCVYLYIKKKVWEINSNLKYTDVLCCLFSQSCNIRSFYVACLVSLATFIMFLKEQMKKYYRNEYPPRFCKVLTPGGIVCVRDYRLEPYPQASMHEQNREILK